MFSRSPSIAEQLRKVRTDKDKEILATGGEFFFTDEELQTFWTIDTLQKFFSSYRVKASHEQLFYIRSYSVRMLSILVETNEIDKSTAKSWLAILAKQKLDGEIPFTEKSYYSHKTLLSILFSIFEKFQKDYSAPSIIRAGGDVQYFDRGRQVLPILKRKGIGQGAQGDVFRIEVAGGCFEDEKKELREEAQVFAMKKLKHISDAEKEIGNLRIIHEALSTHKAIAIYRAVFRYDKIDHILSDLAEANLRSFLEDPRYDEHFGRPHKHRALFYEIWVLADALFFLHSKLIVGTDESICCHMDIKPENILVFEKNKHFRLKISDFGISRVKRRPRQAGDTTDPGNHGTRHSLQTTKTSAKRGEGEFVAPEMRKGTQVGRAVDIWSLGCVIITILIRAFEGRSGLKKFEDEKSDPKKYWNDFFYSEIEEPGALKIRLQLKDVVKRWLEFQMHENAYYEPIAFLQFPKLIDGSQSSIYAKTRAQGILKKLQEALTKSLETSYQDRILSEEFRDRLGEIHTELRPKHFDELVESAKRLQSVDEDKICDLIVDKGLKTYRDCFRVCQVNNKMTAISFILAYSGSFRFPGEEVIEKAWKLASEGTNQTGRIALGQSLACAGIFLIHLELMHSGTLHNISSLNQDTLRRFSCLARWVECNCVEGCQATWNFANPKGIYGSKKNDIQQRCKYVAYKLDNDQRGGFDANAWAQLQKEWTR